jgi:hypothetical protein
LRLASPSFRLLGTELGEARRADRKPSAPDTKGILRSTIPTAIILIFALREDLEPPCLRTAVPSDHDSQACPEPAWVPAATKPILAGYTRCSIVRQELQCHLDTLALSGVKLIPTYRPKALTPGRPSPAGSCADHRPWKRHQSSQYTESAVRNRSAASAPRDGTECSTRLTRLSSVFMEGPSGTLHVSRVTDRHFSAFDQGYVSPCQGQKGVEHAQ